MVGFRDISGIGEGSAELLEAAGYPGLRDLAAAAVPQLVTELKKANDTLKILKKAPSLRQIERWVEEARELTGEEPAGLEEGETREPLMPAAEDDREVDFEADPDVVEMLANAPLAIPVPPGMLMGQEIQVGDVASGVLLRRVRGDLEIRVDTRQSKRRRDPLGGAKALPNQLAGRMPDREPVVRRGIDVSRVRSIEEYRQGAGTEVTSMVQPASSDSRLETLRTPSAEINRGKDPRSRTYIRGVLHPNPMRLTLASLATLGVILMVPFAVAASALLLMSDAQPDRFHWVPPWFLVIPLLLPLFGCLYLAVAVGCHCRICNQRVFVPRSCHKHVKAHHVRGLGYVIPMATHILTFKWFRCTYCGTAVRLKK